MTVASHDQMVMAKETASLPAPTKKHSQGHTVRQKCGKMSTNWVFLVLDGCPVLAY